MGNIKKALIQCKLHTLLQPKCEKCKSVLAETKGVPQKVQKCVERGGLSGKLGQTGHCEVDSVGTYVFAKQNRTAVVAILEGWDKAVRGACTHSDGVSQTVPRTGSVSLKVGNLADTQAQGR